MAYDLAGRTAEDSLEVDVEAILTMAITEPAPGAPLTDAIPVIVELLQPPRNARRGDGTSSVLTWGRVWITIAICCHISRGIPMRTIQMTLDDDLVESVDEVVKELHTTRSAFTRDALREALRRFHLSRLEEQHRRGYDSQPVQKGEFSVWEKEQNWGDE